MILTSTDGGTPSGTAPYTEQIEEDTRRLTATVPADAPREFYRLRVVESAP